MRPNKQFLAILILGLAATVGNVSHSDQRIKVGFPAALTGDASSAGIDQKNAAIIANRLLADSRYEFIFEDEKCSTTGGVTAAQKLINFDKVKYALGFTCNGALLASAELYARAGVKIITSSATSGDVPDIGRNIYRLFPADQGSIQVLYPYIARRHKRVGVISEDDAYAQLLKKHFDLANEAAEKPLELVTDDFSYQETDFRALLLKLKGKEIDAIFINAATDGTFTRAVKQMRQMNFSPHIYGVYVPVSDASIGELGSRLDGAIAATLPDMVTIAGKNALGKRLIDAYVAEFGAIKSPWPVVPFTMEAFRLFHSSLSGGKAIEDLVKTPEFMKDSLIGPYTFSKHGAAEGIRFVLRQVKDGKAVDLAD